MGTETLIEISDEKTNPTNVSSNSHFNQYISAICGDIIPRNSSGVPADLGGNLGETNIRWNDGYIVTVNAETINLIQDTVVNSADMNLAQSIYYNAIITPKASYSSTTGLAGLITSFTFTPRGYPVLLSLVAIPQGSGGNNVFFLTNTQLSSSQIRYFYNWQHTLVCVGSQTSRPAARSLIYLPTDGVAQTIYLYGGVYGGIASDVTVRIEERS